MRVPFRLWAFLAVVTVVVSVAGDARAADVEVSVKEDDAINDAWLDLAKFKNAQDKDIDDFCTLVDGTDRDCARQALIHAHHAVFDGGLAEAVKQAIGVFLSGFKLLFPELEAGALIDVLKNALEAKDGADFVEKTAKDYVQDKLKEQLKEQLKKRDRELDIDKLLKVFDGFNTAKPEPHEVDVGGPCKIRATYEVRFPSNAGAGGVVININGDCGCKAGTRKLGAFVVGTFAPFAVTADRSADGKKVTLRLKIQRPHWTVNAQCSCTAIAPVEGGATAAPPKETPRTPSPCDICETLAWNVDDAKRALDKAQEEALKDRTAADAAQKVVDDTKATIAKLRAERDKLRADIKNAANNEEATRIGARMTSITRLIDDYLRFLPSYESKAADAKKMADGNDLRVQTMKDRLKDAQAALEACKKKCGGVSMMLRAGPSLQISGTVDTQVAFGFQARVPVTRSGAVVLTPELGVGGQYKAVMVSVGYEHDVFARGPLSVYQRTSLGWAGQFFSADVGGATVHNAMIVPEVGVRYRVGESIVIGCDPLSVPVLAGKLGPGVAYRAMFYGGFTL